MKSLFAGAMALVLSAETLPSPVTTTETLTIPSPFRGSFEVVPMVECPMARGSGVRISDDIVITAAHVVNGNGPCGVEGVPAELAYHQPGRDFVALRVKLGQGFRAIASCEGISPGERYYAYGYANGGKPNVEPLIGTNYKLTGGSVKMRGRVYHGMSGGMVANSEGAFVGITVMLNTDLDWSYVLPLTETYLCQK